MNRPLWATACFLPAGRGLWPVGAGPALGSGSDAPLSYCDGLMARSQAFASTQLMRPKAHKPAELRLLLKVCPTRLIGKVKYPSV